MHLHCIRCGVQFSVKPSRFARGYVKYCSSTCLRTTQREAREKPCLQCGRIIGGSETAPSRERRFCSIPCRAAFYSGSRALRFCGGGLTKDGYHMLCIEGQKILAHRYAMEQHLGRTLLPEEVVHHINGDRLDNRPQNLELLPSGADHRRAHGTFRNETHKECARCHILKSRSEFCQVAYPGKDPHHSYCRPCFNAWRQARRKNGAG